MRITLLLGLCLAFLFPAFASAHYTPGVGDAFGLVRVQEEAGPSLQDSGLYIVAEVPEGYLAFLDHHELASLRAAGIVVEVMVEEDDKSLEYVISYDHQHNHALAEPHPSAELLYEGPAYRVLSVPATLIAEQPNCVPEIQRIYRRPISFVRTPWTEASRTVTADPSIVNALTDITQAPLQTQVQTLQDFVTRHSERNGGLLASHWIRDKFLSYGYADVTLHNYNSWNDNVVCVKPGAVYPDEVIVIGAHYDSINPSNNSDAPGADDNASGSVAVLEAARVLFDIDLERTIVFICFSGEEEGLVGSDAWAEDAANAGMNIIGMINLDMICYLAAGDTEDLDIISNGSSEPMSDLAFEVIDAYVPELTPVVGNLTSGSSDHAAFWAHGFRAIFLFEDSNSYSPYLHSANDVVGLSANSFGFMLKNVKAATAMVGVLGRPFHVSIAHDALGNTEESGPFSVTAEIVSAQPLDIASLELSYRVDGGSFTPLSLVATGQPNEFGTTLPNVGGGAHVEYYLTASDTDGYTVTSPADAPAEVYEFRTGVSFVFVDDAETDQGWTLGVPGDNADTGDWIRADPVGTAYQPEDDHTPDPGTISFVTGNANPGDSAGTNDVDGGRTTLLSPTFDLDGAAWASLSYWRWYTDESNNDDAFYIDISNDGGDNWQSLEVVSASAYPWVKATFDDLASVIPLTDQMQLRFIAEDIGQGSLVEALIDDLEVVAITDDPGSVHGVASLAANLRAFPSPFHLQTSISFTLPHAGETELRIFDATGAEVARPIEEVLEVGPHATFFDGSALASGVYLARLWLDGKPLATSKLMLMK